MREESPTVLKLDYLILGANWDPHTENCPSLNPRAGRGGGLRFWVRVRDLVRAGFFPETHNFHRVIPRYNLVEGLMDN